MREVLDVCQWLYFGAVAAGSRSWDGLYEKNGFPSETVRVLSQRPYKKPRLAGKGSGLSITSDRYWSVTEIPEGRAGDGGGLTEFGDRAT